MASPTPYQLPALQRHCQVLAKYPVSLEASIPGFGKTFVAGFLAKYLNKRPAIICPKAVIPHWHRAMEACGVKPLFVTNYEQVKLDRFEYGRWAVRNRVYEWKLPKDAILIPDEAHRFADRTTQTAKVAVAAARQEIQTLPMSATIAQSPLDMYALGLLLGLHKGADYLGWCFQHGVYKGRFAFEFNATPANLQKLNTEIFPEHGYRATFADIPGFPEERIETIGVEVEKPEEIDSLWAKVQELEDLKGEATEPIVARLRARQQAELLKIPAFKELIKDSVKEGLSVAVFLNFTETIDQLSQFFPNACYIRGGQSPEERQKHIDFFQADRSRIIFCQSQAGGVGVSLHDVHGNFPRRSLISPPESARILIQILGRIRRTGGKSLALQSIIFASNTVEKRVQRAVEKSKNNINAINDGMLDPNAFLQNEAISDAVKIFTS